MKELHSSFELLGGNIQTPVSTTVGDAMIKRVGMRWVGYEVIACATFYTTKECVKVGRSGEQRPAVYPWSVGL